MKTSGEQEGGLISCANTAIYIDPGRKQWRKPLNWRCSVMAAEQARWTKGADSWLESAAALSPCLGAAELKAVKRERLTESLIIDAGPAEFRDASRPISAIICQRTASKTCQRFEYH